MFFSKKQKKLDSKVRYQQKSFASQVKVASQYRRKSQPISDNRFLQLARELGLDSGKRIALILFVIALASYVVFVPNPLFIKDIAVTGGAEDINKQVRESIERYFARSGNLVPRRNSLFVSTKKLAEYVKEQNFLVSSVEDLQKQYSGKLSLRITQKYEAFTVVTPRGAYVAYNDGTIKERIAEGAPIKGVGVSLPTETLLDDHANYFEAPFAKALVDIRKYFPA